jgi:hydrogenase-4 component B
MEGFPSGSIKPSARSLPLMLSVLLCVDLALLGLGVAAVAASASGRGHQSSRPVYWASAVACAVNLALAFVFLGQGGAPPSLVLPIGLPWLSAHFHLDGLAAFFLLVVNLVGGLAALFGLGYGAHDEEPQRILPFFPAFLAGMNLVPLADDAFVFLVAWEFMSLSSWLLVLSSHRDAESRRAGLIYLVMAAFGTAALLLAFGVLAGLPGDYTFTAIRARGHAPILAALVLVLTLIGAGSKAGLVPLHVWLPLAHPAAPSHVSALMSGVMTKVAVYAMVRILFDLIGPSAWWWGVVVLVVGGATAVVGVLFAVIQRDLKTLLAYSTVENIGIVTIGLGLALAFAANGLKPLAGLALIAALFHVLNHALFKSLLFFGAGALLVATGARDIERLGGLIHRMPATSLAFLIGSAAISALPPLNGFASEWLLFQVLLEGGSLPQWGLKFAIPVVGALLALAAALAATCFVRAYGIVFLGRPRSPEASGASEVAPSMRAAMAAGALLCLFIGVFPAAAVRLVAPLAERLVGAPPLAGIASSFFWLTTGPEAPNLYSGAIVLAATVCFGILLLVATRRFHGTGIRLGAAWDCGYPDPSPATQYTGSSFAQPIRRVFGTTAFRAREHVEMPAPGDLHAARFAVEIEDRVWARLYVPIADALAWTTDRMNVLQFLTIRRNLTLMFGALVALLVVIAVLR